MHKLFSALSVVAISALMVSGICGCSGSGARLGNSEAREKAEAAAKSLVDADHSDTMLLQQKILEAKAIQSEYALAGDSDAVKDFDEAFRNYITKNDKSLAAAMFQ